jgi:hypothetical protein
VLNYVVPSRVDDAMYSPSGVEVTLSVIRKAQAGRSSRFCVPNYGGSRIFQLLAELVLQFSVLHFCKPREEKPKKGKGKMALQTGAHCSSLQHPASRGVTCYKKPTFRDSPILHVHPVYWQCLFGK